MEMSLLFVSNELNVFSGQDSHDVDVEKYVFAAQPQADASRLPGKDVNVGAHAVQAPPFAP